MGDLGNMDRVSRSSTLLRPRGIGLLGVLAVLGCWTGAAAAQALPDPTTEAPAAQAPSSAPAPSTQASPTTTTPAPAAAAAPPPYRPWKGVGYGEPGALPPNDGPPPLLPRPPHLRRVAEIVPSVGFAIPTCSSGAERTDRCAGIRSGAQVGVAGLWRVVPLFAVGLSVDVAALRNQPPKRLHLSNASALSVSVAALGRMYLMDEGSLEPYVELALGAGVLGASAREADGLRYDETGTGFLTGLGAGLDVFVGSQLRLGPFLAYSHTFVRNVRRCSTTGSNECTDLTTEVHGVLNGVFQMGVRFSILLGSEY
jgi:hypothetical protein